MGSLWDNLPGNTRRSSTSARFHISQEIRQGRKYNSSANVVTSTSHQYRFHHGSDNSSEPMYPSSRATWSDCDTLSGNFEISPSLARLPTNNSISSTLTIKTPAGMREFQEHWNSVLSAFNNRSTGGQAKDKASKGGVVEDAMDALDVWGREHTLDRSIQLVFYALTSLFRGHDLGILQNASTYRHRAVKVGLIEQMLATGEMTGWPPFYLELTFATLTALLSDVGSFCSAAASVVTAVAASDGYLMKTIDKTTSVHPQHQGVQQSARCLKNTLSSARIVQESIPVERPFAAPAAIKRSSLRGSSARFKCSI